jgi:hypothetical protein
MVIDDLPVDAEPAGGRPEPWVPVRRRVGGEDLDDARAGG